MVSQEFVEMAAMVIKEIEKKKILENLKEEKVFCAHQVPEWIREILDELVEEGKLEKEVKHIEIKTPFGEPPFGPGKAIRVLHCYKLKT